MFQFLQYTDTNKIITVEAQDGSEASYHLHHMAYRCSVKRTGTVLYRYGGDLFYALTVSLGEARTRNPEFKDNLSVVCLDLNKKFHSTINYHHTT